MTGAEDVVVDCGLYEAGRRVPGHLPLAAAGTAPVSPDGFVWVALQSPATGDLDEVARTFGLPALAVEDAVHAHQRPKLEVYGEDAFVVLKPVRYVDHEEVVDVGELALFLTAHAVVTVRHGAFVADAMTQVRAELDARGTGGDDGGGDDDDLPLFGPATVLYRVADRIVDGYEDVVAALEVDVDEIEEAVFGPDGEDRSARIYALKKEVAEFRRAVLPLVRPLERLADAEVPHVPDAARPWFRDVHDHLLRAVEALEVVDRQLTDVLQANSARVSSRQSRVALRQNEDMRKISAWAAIALVPTAIAGIYGMNFEHMPELTWRYGYPAVLLVILGACLFLHRAFRRNGWL
ncbi:magnesium and cobalt transport protein CorA [Cellulomonas marina]|uniref:Magnesium transporter n=1 Tax=Cellulomonas marina TaxID=988821 RepID=A0A1I1ADU8_9CELL|nr:magnesium and cobalt transport protein CorA [Cellulomonas marina]GIG29740.1 magnesium transport protein CorA [Cellulomonas marina]SFB35672.1 magnesium transporter [Cellulomonas marina]